MLKEHLFKWLCLVLTIEFLFLSSHSRLSNADSSGETVKLASSHIYLGPPDPAVFPSPHAFIHPTVLYDRELDLCGPQFQDPRSRINSISSGDVDGDGYDEIAFAKSRGPRAWFLCQREPDKRFHKVLQFEKERWGNNRGASSIELANIDGNGIWILAVGRTKGPNARWQVLRYNRSENQFERIQDGGSDWGNGRSVTAIVTADTDNDGIGELVVGRNKGSGHRWYVYRYNFTSGIFEENDELAGQAEEWGSNRGVTAIAAGDFDGDGDDEIAVGRNGGGNERWAVYSRTVDGNYDKILSGGTEWGNSRRATALAFGDVDGDGNEELIIGRNAGGGDRWFVYSYLARGQERLIQKGGSSWGDSRGVTAVAAGDINSDGRAELIIGRTGGENNDLVVYRYASQDSIQLIEQTRLSNHIGASYLEPSAISFAQVDTSRNNELIVGIGCYRNCYWKVPKYTFSTWNGLSALFNTSPLRGFEQDPMNLGVGEVSDGPGQGDGPGIYDVIVNIGSYARFNVYSNDGGHRETTCFYPDRRYCDCPIDQRVKFDGVALGPYTVEVEEGIEPEGSPPLGFNYPDWLDGQGWTDPQGWIEGPFHVNTGAWEWPDRAFHADGYPTFRYNPLLELSYPNLAWDGLKASVQSVIDARWKEGEKQDWWNDFAQSDDKSETARFLLGNMIQKCLRANSAPGEEITLLSQSDRFFWHLCSKEGNCERGDGSGGLHYKIQVFYDASCKKTKIE